MKHSTDATFNILMGDVQYFPGAPCSRCQSSIEPHEDILQVEWKPGVRFQYCGACQRKPGGAS